MLHERNPAVARLFCVVDLAFVDIRVLDLLEFLFRGVLGKPVEALGAERLGEGTAAGRLLAVVGQLEVGVGSDRGCACVTYFQRDIDDVAVAFERVHFFDRKPVLPVGREPELERILAFAQRPVSRHDTPQSAMVGSTVSGEPALREILVFRAQQHQILRLVVGLLVLEKLEPDQSSAKRIDIRDQEIGSDLDDFALCRDRGWGRHSSRWRGGGNRRRRRRGDCTGNDLGVARLRRGRGNRRRLGSLLLFPLRPEQQERKTENEKQDQSLGIHGLHDSWRPGTGSNPRMPRVAARDAFCGQHRSPQRAVAADRLVGVFRTGRKETATRPEHRAYKVLVAADQGAEDYFHGGFFTWPAFQDRFAIARRCPTMVSDRREGEPASRGRPGPSAPA